MISLQITFVLKSDKGNQFYIHDEAMSVYAPYTFASQKVIWETEVRET